MPFVCDELIWVSHAFTPFFPFSQGLLTPLFSQFFGFALPFRCHDHFGGRLWFWRAFCGLGHQVMLPHMNLRVKDPDDVSAGLTAVKGVITLASGTGGTT